MKLVRKKDPSTVVGSLTEQEVCIFKYPNDAHESKYQPFLKKLQDHYNNDKRWLICDCDHTEQAILILCSLGSHLYARRRPNSTHNEKCHFLNRDSVHYKNNNQSFLPKKSKKLNVQFYKNITDISQKNHATEGDTTQRLNSRLGSLLYRALEDKDLNVLSTAQQSYNAIYYGIEEYIEETPISIAKGLPLSNFFYRVFNDTFIEKAIQNLKNPKDWPKKLMPYCLFVTPVKVAIKDNSIQSSFRPYMEIKIENSIKLPSGRISLESDPYIALFTMVLSGNNTPLFQDAFAIPVLSLSETMPVESNYERDALQVLIDEIRYKNIPAKITKPLFVKSTKDNQTYRPDFIIKLHNKTIYIEVLGSIEESYLEQKMKMKKIAKQNCDYYFSVDYTANQDIIDKEMSIITEALYSLSEKDYSHDSAKIAIA